MLTGILQLALAIAFVVLVCVVTYKAVLAVCLKIIDLCFESTIFRFGICILLASVFCVMGILQLKDFVEETEHGMSRFFPLSFLASGIFLFLIFWKRKKT
jgi:hypothetical protein